MPDSSSPRVAVALRYISAFATLTPAAFSPLLHPAYHHTFLPASVAIHAPYTRDTFLKHIDSLRAVLASFPVTPTEVYDDGEKNSVVVFATSRIIWNREARDWIREFRGGTPAAEWEYEGTYVFRFVFADDGTKIKDVSEFVDSKGTDRVRELIRAVRTGSNQMHNPTVLPAEIIDNVLGHLVAALVLENPEPLEEGSAYVENYSVSVKALGSLARVCRSWRGPAQRRMMRKLVVKFTYQAEQLAPRLVESGFQSFVKEITFSKFWDYHPSYHPSLPPRREKDVSIEHYLNLLLLLPKIHTISIRALDNPVPFNSDAKLPASFPTLRNLKTLNFHHESTLGHQRNISILYSILSSAPNLSNLTISCPIYGEPDSLIDQDFNLPSTSPPISLPHLTKLRLVGCTPPSALVNFFDPSTFAGVTALEWRWAGVWFDEDAGRGGYSMAPLLSLIGPSLRKLSYLDVAWDHSLSDVVSEMNMCPSLEEVMLIVKQDILEEIIGLLPSTIKSITLASWGHASQLLQFQHAPESRAKHPASLQTLRFLDGNVGSWESSRRGKEILSVCESKGVEIVFVEGGEAGE
ncbi:hypothetical protein P7C70_g1066, partial [Phenoliferia sp. Uapishka_3]